MAKHIVIIGAGPAGIEAAKAASRRAKVTLVAEERVGGRAAWHSLLPSKVWLSVADHRGNATHPIEANKVGQILNRIQHIKESWFQQQQSELEACQVEIVAGHGIFSKPNHIDVRDTSGNSVTRLTADATIIATGSVPIFPPDLKPDGNRVIAPRFASKLLEIPPQVLVIGGGVTGCEFTYLFNRLGAQVTWIVDAFGVLPGFSPTASQFLTDVLVKRGVRLVHPQLAKKIERSASGAVVVTEAGDRFQADLIFVAIGRKPDLERLNLEATGLNLNAQNALTVNGFGQTGIENIYAVGDATGAPMVANRGMAQGWIAGLHASGTETQPFNGQTVIKAAYTDPQVAQIGELEGEDVQRINRPYAAVLKTHVHPANDGFIELVYRPDGQITGAAAVGPQAADVLAPIATAIQFKSRLSDLAALYGAHPTVTELAFVAARRAEV